VTDVIGNREEILDDSLQKIFEIFWNFNENRGDSKNADLSAASAINR
jgi:hypothetical protein